VLDDSLVFSHVAVSESTVKVKDVWVIVECQRARASGSVHFTEYRVKSKKWMDESYQRLL